MYNSFGVVIPLSWRNYVLLELQRFSGEIRRGSIDFFTMTAKG
jgi:hypothetical protein